jgi:hypothetical protein
MIVILAGTTGLARIMLNNRMIRMIRQEYPDDAVIRLSDIFYQTDPTDSDNG